MSNVTFHSCYLCLDCIKAHADQLQEWYERGALEMRERCAKVCDELGATGEVELERDELGRHIEIVEVVDRIRALPPTTPPTGENK